MNDTNNGSTDPNQWYHYYQQSNSTAANPASGVGFGLPETDNTIVTTSFTTNNTSGPNNSTSLGTSDAHLNPQGSSGKPIRRRSRASRRTPTTLLNASTTNFRSLVQQFTGCHNTKGPSFGSQKGPVNLSFGNQNDQQVFSTSSRIAPLGPDYTYNQQINPVVQQHWQQQQQQQQEMYGNSQINNNNFNNMQSGGLDDFGIDDVPDLHELVDESSSFSTGDNNRDGSNYYF
ncbi:hypothetical protein DCAR_0100713 [Daucus carota subsp. sativus]|uniref:VQ domain-containing protein n=1 Tax=Daucus carota subsp. sativus TaxID=79200 RepID=A0A166FVA8_DAUCS|nr:PREDICTED: VQ motif-containing protein 22-like [Daucus carota subsp. sativus]WOG81562.1 hypothetical protein DCAR_0100713 [Daucus carota subsp. sativus]